VLPVRLPTAPSNQPILDHHLADPSRWHKIDLVRRRDPSSPGGWRYEAHLMVLTTPYVSPSTASRRARVAVEAIDRTAGVEPRRPPTRLLLPRRAAIGRGRSRPTSLPRTATS
jgi:hypothetical protein